MEDIIANLKAKFPRSGWAFIRTKQEKPFGYIGYMLTIYDKDDITILHDIKGRNLKTIFNKMIRV